MTKGQRIQKLRTDAALSQEAFASKIGVSRQSVSKWEADKAFPEVDKLAVIAREFGVTCDWLITGEDILVEDEEQTPAEKTVTIPKARLITLLVYSAVSTLAAIGFGAYLLLRLLG